LFLLLEYKISQGVFIFIKPVQLGLYLKKFVIQAIKHLMFLEAPLPFLEITLQ